MNELAKELERLEARDQRELLDAVTQSGDDPVGFLKRLHSFRYKSSRYGYLSDDEFLEVLKADDDRFERHCDILQLKLGYRGNQDGMDDMLDQAVWNHELADEHGFECVGDALLSFWNKENQ